MDQIIKSWNGRTIRIRETDRYVNLTDMAQATGKRVNNWTQTNPAQEFLQELESVAGIPVTELIQTNQGGIPSEQGTWAHPKVAITFAQWCSPAFAVQVSYWVDELMTVGNVSLLEPEPQPLPPKDPIVLAQQLILTAERNESLPDGKLSLFKQLMRDHLTEQLEVARINRRSLPSERKRYTIAKNRAIELGYSFADVDNGAALGRYIAKRLTSVGKEPVGKFMVHCYEVNNEFDNCIHEFFRTRNQMRLEP